MRPVIWAKKWPHWHTLIFGNDIKIDMRFVCPKDVQKMLVQTDRSVYWKGKWGACGWAAVQLDYDEEMEPLHGMYGSVEAYQAKSWRCRLVVKKLGRIT